MTPLEEKLNAIKVCIEKGYPEAEDHILDLLRSVRMVKELTAKNIPTKELIELFFGKKT